MKASDYIVQFIADRGTDTAFVFTGGAISHVIDSFRHFPNRIRYVCVQNEQVGAMAAEAYSRTTGRMGVAMATSGPGGTNMLTGIVGAWYDCIPALYITGQVRTWDMTGNAGLLQRGFQEVSIVDMAKPVTKYATTVTRAEDLRYELEKAYAMAYEGRPGPVLLDLPMNVQWEEIEPSELRGYDQPDCSLSDVSNADVSRVLDLLQQSSRPLIVVGGGIRHADAQEEFKCVVEKFGIPTIFSYAGYDLLAYDHPNHCGVMGQFGQYGANFSTSQADLILALGTRFSNKQVGNNPEGFAPDASIIAVNIDSGELDDCRVKADVNVRGDIKNFLVRLSQMEYQTDADWCAYVRNLKASYPVPRPSTTEEELVNPYALIEKLSEIASDDAVIIPDVGQNVIVTAQAIRLKEGQRLFSSWANSPMGYSLPASIGVQCGFPNRQVICIIGDGGTQVNIQDLQTVVNYELPIKILLWNNGCYATIQEYQGPNLEGRFEATDKGHGYSHPDFSKIASAYGIAHVSIQRAADLGRLQEFLTIPGSAICEVAIDPKFRVALSVSGNDPLHCLSPKITISPFHKPCLVGSS